jgi:hypothetical protein
MKFILARARAFRYGVFRFSRLQEIMENNSRYFLAGVGEISSRDD